MYHSEYFMFSSWKKNSGLGPIKLSVLKKQIYKKDSFYSEKKEKFG